MSDQAISAGGRAWVSGVRDATPLLGGYIPVAISFGLIANQAGFSSWEAIIISLVIYAGASQFLFVGMVASGAPLWLVVVMTLLILRGLPKQSSLLGMPRFPSIEFVPVQDGIQRLEQE